MRRVKQIFSILLLAGVLIVSTTACGGAEPTADSGGTSAVSQDSQAGGTATDTTNTQYSTDNDTKVKQMLEKVTFNGKPLKFPYKASDLGEGFTFDSDVGVYGDNDEYAIATIKYNGATTDLKASIKDYTSSQKPEDFVAYTISYYSIDDDITFKDMLQVDGIGAYNTLDDVLKEFGEPTLQEETDNTKAIYYRIDDTSEISFCSDKENNITSIYVKSK